jgi:hypothetical protein
MDIVERLRNDDPVSGVRPSLAMEAADEIEWLRKIVIRLNMIVPDDDYALLPEEMRKTIEALGGKSDHPA